jgi:hypothetical protein
MGHAHPVKKAKGAPHTSRGGLEGPLPCGAGEAGWGCPSRKSLLLSFTCPVKEQAFHRAGPVKEQVFHRAGLSWLLGSLNQAKRKRSRAKNSCLWREFSPRHLLQAGSSRSVDACGHGEKVGKPVY